MTNVPPGDCTFVIAFNCATVMTGSPTYSIVDGAQNVAADVPGDIVTGSYPWTHTITYSGVPINVTETIDIDLGNTGG